MIYLNRIVINPIWKKNQSPYYSGQKSHILLNWSVIISSHSAWSQTWNLEWLNMPSLLACVYQNLLKCRRLKPKTKRALTLNKNKRKQHQPRFQLRLITESCGRRALGLLTSSAVVHLWKMPRTMFLSIQTLFEWQIYWTFLHFSVRRDFLFPIFVCWLYEQIVSSMILALFVH